MTIGPQDPAAAGRDQTRAGHADREQVLETLKDAFVHGRLTKDELDTRAGRALAARTYADLAALTADIPTAPSAPAAATSARTPAPPAPPAPSRRRPLARAVAGSGSCMVIAAAAVRAAAIFDPGPPGPTPYHPLAPLMLVLAFMAVLAALGFAGYGVATSVERGRSRRQLPPSPGPSGHSPDGELHGSSGHGPVPPGPHTEQTRADLRPHTSRQRRRHVPARAGRTLRGVRPMPDAA